MLRFSSKTGYALNGDDYAVFDEDTQHDDDCMDISMMFGEGREIHVFNIDGLQQDGDVYVIVPGSYETDPLTTGVITGPIQVVAWETDDEICEKEDGVLLRDVTATYAETLRSLLTHLYEHWETYEGKLAINAKNPEASTLQIEMAREELAGSCPSAKFEYHGRQGGHLVPLFSIDNGQCKPFLTNDLSWLSGSLGMLNRFLDPYNWSGFLGDLEKIKGAVDDFKTLRSDLANSEESFELSA